MRHTFRMLPLALAGALSLGLLSGCGGGGEPAATPEAPPALVSESLSPAPTESPALSESAAPEASESPAPSQEPSAAPSEQPETPSNPPSAAPTAKPTAKPSAAPKPSSAPTPAPTPEPTQAPSASSVLESVWNDIAQNELPMLTDLNDATLQAVYGINAADLEAYICKMPAMDTQATEFFLAKVKDGKLDTVKAAVEQRQADLVQQWSQYLPEQLELVENYQLVTNGNYILFAIGECAEDAVDAFNTYTK